MRWPWQKPAPQAAPALTPGPKHRPLKIRPSPHAVRAKMAQDTASSFRDLFPVAPAPPGVPKGVTIAMDDAMGPFYGYATNGMYGEGVAWLGFPYLAELTQRPEYRMITEVRAKEMTRKGFELTSTKTNDKQATKRLEELKAACDHFKVIHHLRIGAEHEGFYGGGTIFIDLGDENPAELATPLAITPEKIAKGSLKRFRNIEAMWVYPGPYNANDPIRDDYFKPQTWYVNSRTIHTTRLLTLISREMPDILKPAYSFRGLSLSQMAKPYVDNWLRTRQSVSDLLHSFSIIVLLSNLQGQLGGDGWDTIYARVDEFNALRDNRGAFVADKDTEDMKNLAVPLGTIDALQAQSQEQMCSVSQTPTVKLLGIQPAGLNACLTGDTLIFTDRGYVPIKDIILNDKVLTRNGFAPLTFSGITKHATVLMEIKTAKSTIRCTDNHPIWVSSIGAFVRAENVRPGDRLLDCQKYATNAKRSLFRPLELQKYIVRKNAKLRRDKNELVLSVKTIKANEPVYDLSVEKGYLPEFFANNILVHNSSEGEIRTFYDTIHALQEHLFGHALQTMLKVLQLHLWGEIDPTIGHKWVPLWQLDEAAEASVRKTDADTAAVYVQEGVLSPEEVREALAADKDSPWAGLDPADLPEPPQDPKTDISGNPAKGIGETRSEERDGE